MIIKLDEGALKAAKFPDSFIQTMRHIVAQVGAVKFETTLPEVASQTDGLTPIVNNLTITLSATNQAVAVLETETSEHSFIDTSIARRLDELQAELERGNGERAAMAREISLLRDDLGMYESGQIETGQSIRFKLGVTTLSGSNTGDQTLASLGAAAVAGSSTQPFATAALTTSTVAASDNISITRAVGVPKLTLTATTGTNETYAQFINTGGSYYFGVENSAGSWFGATAYAAVTVVPAGKVIQQIIGGVLATTTAGNNFTVAGGFGCNTKAAQSAFALGVAATDLPTVITLANNLRTMAINNGMGS